MFSRLLWHILLRSYVLVIVLIFLAIVVQGKVNRNYGFHSSGSQMAEEFYGLEFSQLDGGKFSFDNLRDKMVLITNVASECGYTDVNYAQLKQLSEEFGDDLAIILIPSNDFGKQEPGDASEIIKFIQNRGGNNYVVLTKSAANGPNQHPLLKNLKAITKTESKNIAWNFETKFIVSPDGQAVSRYSDAYEPLKLVESIRYYVRNKHAEL